MTAGHRRVMMRRRDRIDTIQSARIGDYAYYLGGRRRDREMIRIVVPTLYGVRLVDIPLIASAADSAGLVRRGSLDAPTLDGRLDPFGGHDVQVVDGYLVAPAALVEASGART